VLMLIATSGGSSTPSMAEYSSRRVSGSLKRREKMLSLCFSFALMWASLRDFARECNGGAKRLIHVLQVT